MKDKTILYLIIFIQTIWAVMLFMSKDVTNVTSIYTASALTALVGANEILTALLYLVASSIMFYAIRYNKSLRYFVPQIILSYIAVFGCFWATFSGAYLDGTKIPAAHIFADQLTCIVINLATGHVIFANYIKHK